MRKRGFILPAAAALGLAFICCDTHDETLSWYSTVDVPVNLELRVGRDVEKFDDGGSDSYIVDMSRSSFTIEEIFLIKKLRNPTVEYKIDINNSYKNLAFVFYALLAHKDEGIEEMSIEEVYDIIVKEEEGGESRYINVFGRDGFEAKADGRSDTTVELRDERQVGLILNSPSISWRWLAKVSKGDFGAINDGQAIDIRFRLRVRGVSNLDSLLTF